MMDLQDQTPAGSALTSTAGQGRRRSSVRVSKKFLSLAPTEIEDSMAAGPLLRNQKSREALLILLYVMNRNEKKENAGGVCTHEDAKEPKASSVTLSTDPSCSVEAAITAHCGVPDRPVLDDSTFGNLNMNSTPGLHNVQEHYDPIPLDISLAEDSRAKVTILAQPPFNIVSASQNFTKLYNLCENQLEELQGQDLSMLIFGPRTDHVQWFEMLEGARRGRRQDGSLWTRKPEMSPVLAFISVFPVVEYNSVSHFMVVFSGCLQVPAQAQLKSRSLDLPQITSARSEAFLPESLSTSSLNFFRKRGSRTRANSERTGRKGVYIEELLQAKQAMREIIYDLIAKFAIPTE